MTNAPERKMPLTKTEREEWVFAAVYDPDAYHTVVHQDRPDFVVTLRLGHPPFGVEVTELHRSEADARLLHHATYFTELLAGTRRMHADDPATLGVTTVTVSDKDGNIKHEGLRALIRQQPTHAEHSDALAEVIRVKDAKASQYQPGLSHISLIVFDTFGSDVEPQTEYTTSHLFTPSLRVALTDACFDEVFLVAPDAHGALWHRPLRLLRLLEAFRLFGGALEAYNGAPPDLEPSDLAGWFAALTDVPGVRLGADQRHGADWATCGRYAIRCGDTIEVLDHHDLGADAQPVAVRLPVIPNHILVPLSAHMREFSRSQVFSCQLWYQPPTKSEQPPE